MALGAALPLIEINWSEREAEMDSMPGMGWRAALTAWMHESQERGTAKVVSKVGRDMVVSKVRDTDGSAFVCFVLICDYSRRYVYC